MRAYTYQILCRLAVGQIDCHHMIQRCGRNWISFTFYPCISPGGKCRAMQDCNILVCTVHHREPHLLQVFQLSRERTSIMNGLGQSVVSYNLDQPGLFMADMIISRNYKPKLSKIRFDRCVNLGKDLVLQSHNIFIYPVSDLVRFGPLINTQTSYSHH